MINEAKLSNAAPYASSKSALSTIFAKLNASYEEESILFMSLCPGQVKTRENSGRCK
jgi:NAD(P)-dependent dehydrogenase (short-subunit alcohol dehydrogenase family)